MQLLSKILKPSKGFLIIKIVVLGGLAVSTAVLGVVTLINQDSPGKVIAFLVIGNLLVSTFSIIELRKTLNSVRDFSAETKKIGRLPHFQNNNNSHQVFFIINDQEAGILRLATPKDLYTQIRYDKSTGGFAIEIITAFNRGHLIPLLPLDVPSIARDILINASGTQTEDHVMIKVQDWVKKRNYELSRARIQAFSALFKKTNF